jgi:hypothetical protein
MGHSRRFCHVRPIVRYPQLRKLEPTHQIDGQGQEETLRG